MARIQTGGAGNIIHRGNLWRLVRPHGIHKLQKIKRKIGCCRVKALSGSGLIFVLDNEELLGIMFQR